MDRNPSEAVSATVKRSLKRKLDQEFQESLDGHDESDLRIPSLVNPEDHRRNLSADIRSFLEILDSASGCRDGREAAKRALDELCELGKNDEAVDVIVDCGAIPLLVKHLCAPMADGTDNTYELEVERGCAFAIGILAVKPEYQQRIVDAGALSPIVTLLRRHKKSIPSRALNGVTRRAADAITNLAHENSRIKTLIRMGGAIPPLVELLAFSEGKVQKSVAAALRTLAFKNDENKKQIVECNALPTLVLMLQSEDAAIHYEAVGVIGNLVHSSPNIKKEVLQAGALQPVISLLRSCCSDSQREAALLLGQFAAVDSDCKVHIVQRGAIGPLLELLESSDSQLKEMSAFAIGRLAQDTHNQAGIAHNGGIVPLFKLLDSKNGSLQHNAAFALFGLSDNEDNAAEFVKFGCVQKLLDGEFIVQPTKDCVAKTLKRLEDKINGRVLNYLLYLMRAGDRAIQRRVALGLAHLCSPAHRKNVFIDNNGLELLIELLECSSVKQKKDASLALHKVATRATSISQVEGEAAPASPTPQVYLGEQYVNNPTLSDVTFLVEDAFCAMFDGGYRERNAKDVEIPNIKWEVFELMMRFIYTGSVNVDLEIAQDVLRAADQYLLEGLKRLCEYTIAQDINVENVSLMYELSEAFHAISLRQACILFVLEQFDQLITRSWYPSLIQHVIPEIRRLFTNALTRPVRQES